MHMSSRMDKYNTTRRSNYNDYDYEYQEPVSYGSRSRKNEELYQGMTRSELEDINLTSNAHVIGENEKNIDVEKIKELLEKNYAQEPRKSRALIKQQQEQEEEEPIIYEEEETKEYNINAIIEKAKQDKEIDYERERLKKVRDTQYDILRGLSLDEEDDEEPLDSKVTSHKEDLVNLINTITEKELTREIDPLDILTDLKGSDNTVVLDGMNEEIEKREKQEAVKKEEEQEEKKGIDKTFYTNSVNFSKSDFDDFNDLKEDMETNKVLIRVLLIIITIAFIAGILFFANQFFHLNWF